MDRSKTELTQNITRNVSLWLDGKGFKPVETEVYVGDRWIADVAGVGLPTQTEMIDLKLIKRAPRYRSEADQPKFEEWRAAMAAIPGRLMALVEVKTSWGDYRGDRKWTAERPAHLCYVAIPEGMVHPDDWPAGWGVILFSQEGTTIRKVHPPEIASVAVEQQLNFLTNLAVARDHVTRHARIREFQKTIRISDGERKVVARVASAISAVRDIMKGKSIEQALEYHGIKIKTLPAYVMEDLAELAKSGGDNKPTAAAKPVPLLGSILVDPDAAGAGAAG